MTKFYFAEDGNWGDADGLSVVDTDGLDEHFIEYVDSISEYDRSAWSAWFANNNHEMPADGDGECYYCEWFEVGSLTDIDAKFDGEE